MKTFILFISLLVLPLVGTAKGKTNTIEVQAQDFVVTYLSAQLSKNPFLDKKQGWGMFIYSETVDGKTYVKADGIYFDKKEIKEIEAAQATAQRLFNELAERYSLNEKLIFKAEIKPVQNPK